MCAWEALTISTGLIDIEMNMIECDGGSKGGPVVFEGTLLQIIHAEQPVSRENI
ncbi:hypothetical protein J15TS10_00390 [Paenibacillus woosongensis]|uniref:Uncharacterized protein n=1 Tax=Paenibacillus woosongensis TaxID=307580 RepID=A0ABQ4MJQ7_9BACL|nr:hypothetical protein J15TS10_00390 [Paenibacillus woosongensis]